MILFSLLALFKQVTNDVINDFKIDEVVCTIIISSDGTFAIGDGKNPAFGPTEKQNISIPATISYLNKKYNIAKISEKAFYQSTFNTITLPDLHSVRSSGLVLGECCFQNSKNLVEINFKKSKVKALPNFCFAGCQNLQLVMLSHITESMGKYAFYQTGLQYISICGHITQLGAFCFAESDIEEVDMKTSNLLKLPESLFECCSKLINVSLPPKLAVIPRRCFYNTSVENIIFPKSLTTIEEFCFWNCTKLQEVNLQNTKITSLPRNGFEHCTGLVVLFCPHSLKSIDEYSLSDTGISEFVAPKHLTSLKSGFIQMCSELTTVNLSKISLTSIPSYSFYRCTKLSTFIPPQNMKAVEELAFAQTLISEFPFEGVESLGCSVFSQCGKLVEADLSSLKSPSIPRELFYMCSSLKSVKWPSGDLSIGAQAFLGTALEEVVFPSLVSIDRGAFMGCQALKTVDLTNAAVESFGEEVFAQTGNFEIVWPTHDKSFRLDKKAFASSKITKIILPPQCNELCEATFRHCTDLSFVDLEQTSVTVIPASCFESAGEITVKWPKALQSIEDEAFRQCSIRTVAFPAVSMIGKRAFYECSNLKLADLSNTKVTVIQKECFKYCQKLSTVNFPSSLSLIGNEAFASCNIANLVLPESLKTIGDAVFAENRNLEIIDLTRTVLTEIPQKTFSNCLNVKTLMLPKDIKKVSSTAFEGIQNIKEVYFPGTEFDGDTFSLPSAKVFVPNEYKGNKFAGIDVKRQSSFEPENVRAQKQLREEDEDQTVIGQNVKQEESHTTRNAFIGVVIVVLICVFVWYKFDPYGLNGSEGVELEGELPWYRKMWNHIMFKFDQFSNKNSHLKI